MGCKVEKNRTRKIFVLGDSISIHYGPYLKSMLTGTWEYDRKREDGQSVQDLDQPAGGNGGDSRMVFEYIRNHCNELGKYDMLLLNCGLHDIKTHPETMEKQVSQDEYVANLGRTLELLEKLEICTIWVRTTPVSDELHNRVKGFFRYNRDVEQYNKAADRLMEEKGIQIIDLYSFTRSLGEELHYDGVHFHERIRQLQAAFLAGWLQNCR